ncbi:MAG: DUF1080 domain-containing protein [Pirellulales bacterium]
MFNCLPTSVFNLARCRYNLRTFAVKTALLLLACVPILANSNVIAQEPKALKAQPSKEVGKEVDKDGWKPLLEEKELEGWTITDFYGHGEVKREGEILILEPGKPLTGITSKKKDFPTSNFEIEFEARRTKGNDFLCGLTFPVGKGFASFIGGGWGGGLVGLSSVDGADASENSTSSHVDFKNDQWYKFRILVDDDFVRGFVDKKEVFAQGRRSRVQYEN